MGLNWLLDRADKLKESSMAEWRNWQTHQTQNLAKFTLREGSTPSSATNQFKLKYDLTLRTF
jgi:hypothetical protein